jgi:beta-mannosidase
LPVVVARESASGGNSLDGALAVGQSTRRTIMRANTLLSVCLLACCLAGRSPAADVPPPKGTLWQPYRITPRAGAQHVSLDGPWQLSHRDAPIDAVADLAPRSKWIRADVPSTVQWALHRAGLLPHPYEHLNSKQYSWVDEKVWYYRRTIELPAGCKDQFLFLCFDGVDYFSRVWFNGELLGRHEGMFAGPVAEVSRLARPGQPNEIVVEVKAGNFGNKQHFKAEKIGPIIKPWVLAGGLGAETFFPLGIWRGVRIEMVPHGHIERPMLVTESADAQAARLVLSLELFDQSHSLKQTLHAFKHTEMQTVSPFNNAWTAKPSPARFELAVRIADKSTGAVAAQEAFALETLVGRNAVRRSFQVARPKLWWPNAMGDPNLYRVTLTLRRDGAEVDRIEFDYGMRTIQTRPTAGPTLPDRYANWQFVVNGRPLFVKGMNWMPADILLDLPAERYRWLLGMAKAAGIQLIRIWGGGLLETEEFYAACNELGLMVWQDFPIGNQDTPDWPQDVWEAQVMQTIFRLRNHPALVLYCGGNEFNAYSFGNTASIGVLERSVADFDPTRLWRRTSPDAGSLHTYPDMDPTWYAPMYRYVPYISETGMHNIPDPQSMREVVDAAEFARPLSGMFTKQFPKEHPDLIHHFVEYQPSRVPRMLSRASHIDDMRAPTLESLSEGTQIGAGEFYQIFSEGMQANWPHTGGLMPWVFKRPWPVIAIMLVDGMGHPTAPYYFLKRTYEPTHVMIDLPQLIWAKGERVPVRAAVLHAPAAPAEGLQLSVRVLDPRFADHWKQSRPVALKPGPSVEHVELGEFTIPDAWDDKFFFLLAELRAGDGRLVSRSVYWPRCLARMSDAAVLAKYRAAPRPTLTLENGPWLKPQVAAGPTTLEAAIAGQRTLASDRSQLTLRVRNAGSRPAVNLRLNISGTKRSFYATDNFLWLEPGESRDLDLQVLWRDPPTRNAATLTVGAWNATSIELPLSATADPR